MYNGVRQGRQGGKVDKEEERRTIQTHEDLIIYQKVFQAAMTIFELSKKFPDVERYSLTDQISRSSRSVCANLAEAWRKRRYKASFVAKLNDCEAEAAETQVGLNLAMKCNYWPAEKGRELSSTYSQVLSGLVKMIGQPENWLVG
ncbi:MAG: four helix bundle protein [Microcystis wesenbergii TW10]|jgi:four helix bundle protein|uniref:Four helix bundle protein n=1 Tax=Microcystis wesenbergii TW10 TaxID=2060474 RepID=A0A3E0M363_9CHRO|nr:MAG: four helix bundle protein [Microcystis wesenbergii TW10]